MPNGFHEFETITSGLCNVTVVFQSMMSIVEKDFIQSMRLLYADIAIIQYGTRQNTRKI